MRIRRGTAADLDAMITLIREFALYEGDELGDGPDRGEFERNLSGANPAVEVLLAENGGGEAVGLALFSHRFNSATGRNDVIYLSDLFVREAFRGMGLGTELMRALARISAERGGTRIDWAVLNANAAAIGFYRSLGAASMDDRATFRLGPRALADLAAP